MITGVFEVKDKDLASRIGYIYTKTGKILTPTLLPVINPVRQEIKPSEIIDLGFQALITNAYLIRRYRCREALEKGVHKLLGVDKPVMTDSGAYQILQYGDVEVTNEEIVKFQEQIDSDIAVILDVPTGGLASREEAEYTVKETLRRAEEASKIRSRDDILWVLPIQGGTYLDLLEYSVKKGLKLPYHIVAIGSPTQLMERYDFETLIKMIATVKVNVPPGTPIHLFGAGHPMMLAFAIALGVDLFDSAAYILYAKDERYMTPWGTYRLKEISEFPCSCPICVKYTPTEIRELSVNEKMSLIAKHNLYVTLMELKRIRQAIREGRLWELLEEKSRVHPSLHRAFKVLGEYKDYLELLDPEVKGLVQGVFFYDNLSLSRPELLRYRRRILERYVKPKGYDKLIVIVGLKDKPYIRSHLYELLKNKFKDRHVVFYTPFYGVIPEELAETYPLSQFEVGAYDDMVERESINLLIDYVRKEKYKEVLLIYLDEAKTVARKIYLRMLRLNVKCNIRSHKSYM